MTNPEIPDGPVESVAMELAQIMAEDAAAARGHPNALTPEQTWGNNGETLRATYRRCARHLIPVALAASAREVPDVS